MSRILGAGKDIRDWLQEIENEIFEAKVTIDEKKTVSVYTFEIEDDDGTEELAAAFLEEEGCRFLFPHDENRRNDNLATTNIASAIRCAEKYGLKVIEHTLLRMRSEICKDCSGSRWKSAARSEQEQESTP